MNRLKPYVTTSHKLLYPQSLHWSFAINSTNVCLITSYARGLPVRSSVRSEPRESNEHHELRSCICGFATLFLIIYLLVYCEATPH